jgi:hypothetical protein
VLLQSSDGEYRALSLPGYLAWPLTSPPGRPHKARAQITMKARTSLSTKQLRVVWRPVSEMADPRGCFPLHQALRPQTIAVRRVRSCRQKVHSFEGDLLTRPGAWPAGRRPLPTIRLRRPGSGHRAGTSSWTSSSSIQVSEAWRRRTRLIGLGLAARRYETGRTDLGRTRS